MDKIIEVFLKFAELIPGIQDSTPALVALISLTSLLVAVVGAVFFKRNTKISALVFVIFGMSAMALMAYAVYQHISKNIEPRFEDEVRNFSSHLKMDDFNNLLKGSYNTDLANYDTSVPERVIIFNRKWIELNAKYEGLLEHWKPIDKYACNDLYNDIDQFNKYVSYTNSVINSSPRYQIFVRPIPGYNKQYDVKICD